MVNGQVIKDKKFKQEEKMSCGNGDCWEWECLLCGNTFVPGEDGNELGLCETCCIVGEYDIDAYYKDLDAGKTTFKGTDTLSRGLLDPYKK